MSGRHGHRRRLGAAAAIALAAALAGCAPHVAAPPRLDHGTVRERFARALEQREGGSRQVEAEASLWVRTAEGREFPGVQARILLGAPDAVRVRVQSAFGTALDVVARGDSVTAWLPVARVVTALDAAEDSLGVRLPGALGYLIWSAAWSPPASAWAAATAVDSAWVVQWSEEEGSVTLDVGASGLPSRVVVETPSGHTWTARYPMWTHIDGIAWPSRVIADSPGGGVSVTAQVQRVRFRGGADPEAFALRLPERARRIGRAELAEVFERIVELGGDR